MSWFTKLFRSPVRKVASASSEKFQTRVAAEHFCVVQRNLYGRELEVQEIANTNSMVPCLDANAVILVERVLFSALSAGDIAIFVAPGIGYVAHRCYERVTSGWLTLGDNAARVDNDVMTPDRFYGRVAGILYSKRLDDTDD